MTGNKQWKKGYSVRLEQKSQKSFKKICSANFLERFLRFLFKTYQLSLFSIVYSRPPLPPMAQAYPPPPWLKLGHPPLPCFRLGHPSLPCFRPRHPFLPPRVCKPGPEPHANPAPGAQGAHVAPVSIPIPPQKGPMGLWLWPCFEFCHYVTFNFAIANKETLMSQCQFKRIHKICEQDSETLPSR